MPTRKQDLPRTIQRSEEHAQHIYAQSHDSAVETYGEGRRAHQTAYAALKTKYRKSGDKWVPRGGTGASGSKGRGRQVPLEEWSKDDLYDQAQNLDIEGRSKMSKDELVRAIKRAS